MDTQLKFFFLGVAGSLRGGQGTAADPGEGKGGQTEEQAEQTGQQEAG